MENECPKCGGKGYIKTDKGVHTCWECLSSGKLDNHSKDVKESGIKI